MRANSSILTFATATQVGGTTFSYLNLIAAHTGGDWGQHNQARFYAIPYAEPVSGHTITDGYVLRIQLTGTNSDGTGDGVFTVPAINSGIPSNPGGAPIIVQQPQNLAVYVGQVATFRVFVLSAVAVFYQWKKAGVNIDGATASSYVIPNAQFTDASTYSVTVTNQYGTSNSAGGVLTVINRPPGVDAFFAGSGGFFDDLFSFTPAGQIYHAITD